MRKVLVLALATAVAAAVGVPAAVGEPRPAAEVQVERYPTVRILRVHPNPNTGCIGLRIRITGFTMEPGLIGASTIERGHGHYHVYVNGKYHNVGANPRHARACGLERGRSYTLKVILAYNNHTELAAGSQVVTAILR
jgi:hypothetical protein